MARQARHALGTRPTTPHRTCGCQYSSATASAYHFFADFLEIDSSDFSDPPDLSDCLEVDFSWDFSGPPDLSDCLEIDFSWDFSDPPDLSDCLEIDFSWDFSGP